MKIEIKNRRTDKVLFGGEYDSIELAVVAAVKAKADLGGAYLGGACLGGACAGG